VFCLRVVACVGLCSAGAFAQWLNYVAPGTPRTADGKPDLAAPAPRTVDGKPDLSGVWMHEITSIEEVRRLFGRGFDEAILTNGLGMEIGTQHKYEFDILLDFKPGESPLRPEAAEQIRRYAQGRRDGSDVCVGIPGIPRADLLSEPIKIVQAPRTTVILYEAGNSHRQVYTDGRALPKEFNLPAWLGYSVGHWDGDTLVVDVTNLTDATWFDRSGNFHSDALHVVERYTPAGPDVIRYEAVIEDPQVFTRPWKISMPIYRRLESNAQLTEFRCVEMVEETMYGHLRKQQLVKHWVGNTITVDITRTIPPGEAVHERYISGNPPPAK